MSAAAMIKRINSARVSLTQRRLLAGHLTIPSVLITPRTFTLVCFYREGNRKLIYIANIGLICRYTHYLRREDEQLAKNVWDLVQQNNDPTNAPYHFTVRCSPGGAECPAGRYVLTSLSILPFQSTQYYHSSQYYQTSQQFPFSSSTFSTLPAIHLSILFFTSP